jgi:hypothetical protein
MKDEEVLRLVLGRTTKLDAASSQLRLAWQLFEDGQYVAALTLAGAAEEIMGRLVQRGVSDELPSLEFVKGYLAALGKSEDEVNARNVARNWVKHAGSSDPPSLPNHVLFASAGEMLGRAVHNLVKLDASYLAFAMHVVRSLRDTADGFTQAAIRLQPDSR